MSQIVNQEHGKFKVFAGKLDENNHQPNQKKIGPHEFAGFAQKTENFAESIWRVGGLLVFFWLLGHIR